MGNATGDGAGGTGEVRVQRAVRAPAEVVYALVSDVTRTPISLGRRTVSKAAWK